MCETMKISTSSSSKSTDASVDYIYVKSPEIIENVYVINAFKHNSPCDTGPNKPAVNKFVYGVCNCTLKLRTNFFK